jgi:hypothetical protein
LAIIDFCENSKCLKYFKSNFRTAFLTSIINITRTIFFFAQHVNTNRKRFVS